MTHTPSITNKNREPETEYGNSSDSKSSLIVNWDLAGKRVLLRADLNIPLNNGTILDTYKLEALQPTIDLILSKGGSITLITHLGRPKLPTPELSSRHLIPWFERHNYAIQFAATPAQARGLSAPIVLLENIRFFAPEQKHEPEQKCAVFAQELAQLGDYYVNDAFGALHRTDTSITTLAYLFAPEKRTFGLLVEKELRELNKLMRNPDKPFVLIVGGAKVTEKIPLIEQLLPLVDTLILCPAIACTFAYALGHKVGLSLVNRDSVNLCKKIIDTAQKKNITVIVPVDYQVALPDITPISQKDSASSAEISAIIIQELTQGIYKKKLEIIDAQSMPENAFSISIGPKTLAAYKPALEKAGTILFNGALGFAQQPETLVGMRELLKLIHAAPATRIITGGDSVAMVMQLGMKDCFDYLSTGGGATLSYLSGCVLPGLVPLSSSY